MRVLTLLSTQVLPVSAEELEEVMMADAECRASPLLCLSQDSLEDFLRPVRIQLPLPPGVTGEFIPKIGKEKCPKQPQPRQGCLCLSAEHPMSPYSSFP